MITEQLQALSEGLLYMSESDYPFTMLALPPEVDSIDAALKYLSPNSFDVEGNETQPIEKMEVESFFQSSTRQEDWMEEEEKQHAQKFITLRDYISQNLLETVVIKVGEVERTVYLLGHDAEGQWYGLSTVSIET